MLDTSQLPLSGEILLWYRQGLAASAAGNYERATYCYEVVLESYPDFYEAWYERGLALEHQGYYTDAIASFDRALTLEPKDKVACEIWHDRGNALQYGLGDYLSAIACYDKALQLRSDHEQVWQNRGNALLYGLSQPEQALACYTQVLMINTDNPLAWRNRGNALMELRRYEDAIASYNRSLSIQPDDEVSRQGCYLAAERAGLSDRQPTTNPIWYTTGYHTQTFIEGDVNRAIAPPENPPSDATLLVEQGCPNLVVEDDWGRREILLELDQYTIGRDPKSDICLHSRFASRQHAILLRVNQEDGTSCYQVVDGNLDGKPSTNGLLINGQKHRMHTLNPEDTIVFGPSVRAIYRLTPVPQSF